MLLKILIKIADKKNLCCNYIAKIKQTQSTQDENRQKHLENEEESTVSTDLSFCIFCFIFNFIYFFHADK